MTGQFVGRRGELDELTGRLRAGTGHVALVAGEPGIGKTRLANELAAHAEANGVFTCWGRAVQEDGSPPYWAFRQVLRQLARLHPPGELAGELSLVVPEFGDGPAMTPAERFRVFEAVTEYVTGIGKVLIVLDDLQWADPPTLQLLVHLARAIGSAPVMILVTYRDTEGPPALSTALATLTRENTVSRIRLTGLSEVDVALQLADVTGTDLDASVTAAISRRTGGNPFFVAELGRILDQDRLPDAVLDAVRVRLDGLSPDCRDMLTAAAVLGREVDPAIVAEVLDQPLNDTLTTVDEAVQAGVLSDVDGWRFTHDLVREAARLLIPTARRLALHERAATVLEQRPDATQRVAEIAHHWLEALPASDPTKAAEWARRAADIAMAQLAWENAASLYARALCAAPDIGPADRAKLLTSQGLAQLRQMDIVGGEETLRQAAVSARESRDVTTIAEVALAMETVSSSDWVTLGKSLCDEALSGLDDGPLRARLLAQRAAELAFYGAPGLAELSAEALEIADRTQDPRALRAALRARQLAMAGPEGVHERLALGDRMLAIGLTDHDADAMMWGRLWRFDAFCQLGRLADAERELLPIKEAVAQVRTKIARWHYVRGEVAVAHARGRFAEARELALTAIDLVKETGGPVVLAVSVSTVATVASMTGDEGDIVERYPDYFCSPPEIVSAMVGAWHAQCGRLDLARRCYQPAQVNGPIGGMRWLSVLGSLALLAAEFDDKQTAAAAYRRLLPYEDLILCGGAGVVTMHGAVAGALGIAAAVCDRLDDAVRHLRHAIEINERAGMTPYVATARLDLARVLARRDRHGDAAESVALTMSARAIAEQLGMRRLVASAESFSGPKLLSPREGEIARLVAQGLTNKQIAAALHISVRTVETHVQNILGKLGVSNRGEIQSRL
ncbi:AAA family ATPase [Kibdelosporangium philippinense]|uniref:AAA family ATPase n=1 Tax=Kibdelosporangium philippinense TaxID=211113 RepID=A0ABS8ZWP7_9PSEU|nr:LuxR family transcriptional regulator [Kibdelosporangium philippinense]MCE7012126.1 AAA family ATPase [Kibdelosporangium philippinense]